MRLSLNWITDYTTVKLKPQELAARLSETLTEVSQIEKVGADTVLEIENKALTHRPDCFSQRGLAREVAAATSQPFQSKNWAEVPTAGSEKELQVEVTDGLICPRYTMVLIDKLQIKASPPWMQERLLAGGMRPINNLVDVTNYVMLELGQPLHAFDYDKIAQHHIIVRAAGQGEQIQTLDGNQRALEEGTIVITDPQEILAVAGIMGGASSEINSQTSIVALESATFAPARIRAASTRLGLRTEASTRFEKGLDPNLTEEALRMAIDLLSQLMPEAQVASKIIDFYPQRESPRTIEVDPREITKDIGQRIEGGRLQEIFEALGLKVWVKGNLWLVEVPTYRRDLNRKEDLVEEVARIYGYSNLKPTLPPRDLKPPTVNHEVAFDRLLKSTLASLGGHETLSYSFISEELIKATGFALEDCPRLVNALSPEIEWLRPSLLPSLLLTTQTNLKFFEQFFLFELGKGFTTGANQLPQEDKLVAGLVVGPSENWLTFKGLLEAFLEKTGVGQVQWHKGEATTTLYHPERWAKLISGHTELGSCGQISPALAKKLGLPESTYLFEMKVSQLRSAFKEPSYQPPDRFPPVIEDLSVLVDQDLPAAKVCQEVDQADTPELQVRSAVKEVYQDEKMPPNQKSVTVQVIYRSPSRTLTEAEISPKREEIIKTLEKRLKGKVRRA